MHFTLYGNVPRKHGTHRSNVVVIITIVIVSATVCGDARGEAAQSNLELLLRTHLSSGEQSLTLVCKALGDTSLTTPLVSASLDMCLSWLCQLDTPENSLRREPQVRDCLDQTGL